MKDLLKPVPFEEAAEMIKNKPAITREVFDRMIPEIKGRAFTVTLIEDANVLQDVRDIIAELPRGGNWDTLKEQVIEELQAANEWFDDERAAKRAELLLRTHGFQAYAATAYNELDAQRDVFEYWQYLTMEDEAVREAHAALNGVVLPADHPFWNDHYPPWDWGCRCQVIGVSRMEYERIQGQDEGRLPEQKQIIEGERLKLLETQGKLDRGPSSQVDVRSPKERYEEKQAAGKNPPPPYQWNPGDLRIPLESLEAHYADDPDTWKFFVDAAKGTALEDGRSLWEWLSSEALGAESGPLGTPVSGALTVTVTTVKAAVNRAMKAIDKVHGDGKLPAYTVDGKAGKDAFGSHWKGKRHIAVSPSAPHKELTAVHEAAHMLDAWGLVDGSTTSDYGSETALMAEWWAKVQQSKAFSTLPNYTKKLDYWQSKKECFARSYAQFIAKRSKDSRLLGQLKDLQGQSFPQQWQDNDFAGIEAALEKVFKLKGWMK